MRCTHCHSSDNLIKYSRNKVGKQYYICRICNAERARRYRKTPIGYRNQLRAIKKYEREHPERKKSWKKVNLAFVEKYPCKVCGELKVHAHHPDPKRPIEFIYLCPAHHKEVHLLQ